MDVVVLDDCLYYLREAERYLNMMTDISPYEEIFETYKPEVDLKVKQNEKAKTGVMGSMKKALEALKKMFLNLVNSIKNFFNVRKLDNKEREAYESFKNACAKNPELKNKKITVADFRKFNAEYEQILAEAKEHDKKLAENRVMDTDAFLERIGGFCKNVTNSVTVAISADAALNMASSSREIAHMIQKSLNDDAELHAKLEAAMGKAETKRFERQIKSLGKRISLQRAIMKMKKTYSKSVADALDKTFANVNDLVNSVAGLTNIPSDMNQELKIKGNAVSRAVDTGKAVIKNRGAIKDATKAVKKSDIARHIIANDDIRGAGFKATKTILGANKEARKTYKDKKHEAFKRKASSKFRTKSDQSALDSLLGRNDPNSGFYER